MLHDLSIASILNFKDRFRYLKEEAMAADEHVPAEQTAQTQRKVSRRTLLRMAAASAGAMVLAACEVQTGTGDQAPAAAPAGPGGASPSPAAVVGPENASTTLEFWAFSEDRLRFARELVGSETWTSAHSDVAVNFRVFPYNEMHDKLLAALASDRKSVE